MSQKHANAIGLVGSTIGLGICGLNFLNYDPNDVIPRWLYGAGIAFNGIMLLSTLGGLKGGR